MIPGGWNKGRTHHCSGPGGQGARFGLRIVCRGPWPEAETTVVELRDRDERSGVFCVSLGAVGVLPKGSIHPSSGRARSCGLRSVCRGNRRRQALDCFFSAPTEMYFSGS